MLKTEKIKLKRAGFIIKHRNPEAAALALDIAQILLRNRIKVYFASESTETADELKKINKKFSGPKNKIQVIEKNKMVQNTDLIIVLGGDGTYLSIARLMRKRSVPVMGINMGQLGFLTEIKQSEAFDTVNDVIQGKPIYYSERALLEVTLQRNGKTVFQGPVVNDAVIAKGAIARIIGIQIAMNGKIVNTLRADGLIVSTPTGSTAYSLSAGGPIVEPSLGALILTPICPHSLTQRPLVVPDHSELKIRLSDRPGNVYLTLDGQDAVSFEAEDIMTVRRYKKHSLKLIASPTRDYFGLLQEKLLFGVR